MVNVAKLWRSDHEFSTNVESDLPGEVPESRMPAIACRAQSGSGAAGPLPALPHKSQGAGSRFNGKSVADAAFVGVSSRCGRGRAIDSESDGSDLDHVVG